MSVVSELDATTLKLLEVQVEDNLFKNAPFFKKVKDRAKPFSAGTLIQHTFVHDATIGGAYQDGESFNIDIVEVTEATQFRMKRYEQNVSENLEKIKIENGPGDLAKIKLIDLKLMVAVQTMSAQLAIAFNRHGQASTATINTDRVKHINGWPEALNDGVTTSWEGDEFPTYGGVVRANVGAAMNSIPRWWGDAAGNPGQTGYSRILELYFSCCVGNRHPDLILANLQGAALVMEKMQPQQVFGQEKVPSYGAEGFALMEGRLLIDNYFPSLINGDNNSKLGSNLTGTVTSATPASSSGMPTTTSLTVAEVLAMFNTETWDMYVASDAEFGFGWSGFKVARDDSMVAGQHKAALNTICTAPRLNNYAFGFNS